MSVLAEIVVLIGLGPCNPSQSFIVSITLMISSLALVCPLFAINKGFQSRLRVVIWIYGLSLCCVES